LSEQVIEQLNQRFAVPGQLAFATRNGGVTVAEIHNAHADAAVVLHGAQPLVFQPHGHAPVLWVSEHAVYTPGKAIRGGIPIC
jgi:D-hexose-6-phosphate mutarotase